MTYLLMSLPFIALALIGFSLGAVHAHRHRSFGSYLSSWAEVTASLVILTVIFDNVMMAAGLFDYGVEHISGAHIGLIPVEDLLYPVAGALLLAGCWQLLGGSREQSTSRDG